MRTYFFKWNLRRILRLVMGIVIIIQGVQAEQWPVAGLGGVFSLMTLFNISLCSNGSCAVPVRTAKRADS